MIAFMCFYSVSLVDEVIVVKYFNICNTFKINILTYFRCKKALVKGLLMSGLLNQKGTLSKSSMPGACFFTTKPAAIAFCKSPFTLGCFLTASTG